jgi:hypothetical protein
MFERKNFFGRTTLIIVYQHQPIVVKYLIESGKCDSVISTIDLNDTTYLAESIEHIKNYKKMKIVK